MSIGNPKYMIFNGVLPGEVLGAMVQETGLKCMTQQHSMSTGMFRVFSLLAQLNYHVLSGKSGCIIIDDIGDGLDFEQTVTFIDLIREKIEASNMQLIMSTNNRFIMNHVPIEEWCVLRRSGSHVSAKNYSNSKEQFDDFKMTGFNNFDMFATDYLFSTTTEVIS